MPKITYNNLDGRLYVIRDGEQIEIVEDIDLKEEKYLIDTLNVFRCFNYEETYKFPKVFLNNYNRNNFIYALIARLKQLENYDISEAVFGLEKELATEDKIKFYRS